MSVNAKFKVSKITPVFGGTLEENGGEIEMVPDYAGGRNADWSKYTPSGVIRMTVTNPAAIEQFTQNRPFTVTFEAEDE